MTRSSVCYPVGIVAVILTALTVFAVAATTNGPGYARDAAQLVMEYVKRDSLGGRLDAQDWFDHVVTWEEEPAWDGCVVIDRYDIGDPQSKADDGTITIDVGFHRVGWINFEENGSWTFAPGADREDHPFIVLSKKGTPLIFSPQMAPHVLGQVVLKRHELTRESAAKLGELLK